jgi:hypothetical protein
MSKNPSKQSNLTVVPNPSKEVTGPFEDRRLIGVS